MPVYKSSTPTKDGRTWYFSTYYVDLDGVNKKKKSKKFHLKKEAEEAERIFLMTYTEKGNSKDVTFEDLILDYLQFQKSKVKITTFNNYNKHIKKLEDLKNIKIKDFNINHFNLWKNNIDKEKFSTRYKNNIYKFLRSLLNYATKHHNFTNLIHVLNKMTGFNTSNEIKKEMNYYTYEEFIKYIQQEDNLNYKCFFQTIYYCGLRKGETNALMWKDIDFEKKVLHVNKSIDSKIKGEKYVILPPKTKSSIRTLPIPKNLLEDLKTLKNNMTQYKNFSDNWFVFGGPVPLPNSSLQKRNSRNAKKSELHKIRIHDFRHSCASLLISNGASISLVARYLGHSNITTTLNTYTHMFKNEFDEILKVINNLK